jgi:hypothetical protein
MLGYIYKNFFPKMLGIFLGNFENCSLLGKAINVGFFFISAKTNWAL